ncbi:Transposon Ty3-G Gag-Pol polyprotein [Labeo rohita]|uniref:ribonuclease H n=1 Tax=Labeo rohita TaxID=84645 RepID=A0ABQ8N115_LABRO|nr:Transposon Ty3-G Gag-Pol polyprotein [Labeo rohita]
MSKSSSKSKHISKPGFRACVPPCSRYISSGDTHALCVACMGAEHAASALEGGDCPHCDVLPMRVLRSRKALFSAEGAFISVPHGSGPASAEAERRLHSWGSQLDLVEGMETGDPLSPASPTKSAARPSGSEARAAEVDVVSLEEAAAPQFPQYEELLEVVTRAVAKLSIDWPAEPLVEPQKSKLDERFLRSRPPPARRSLPFFPDLHTEVSRSWNTPFSSRLFIPASYNYGYVAGLDERGYRAMPRVEQTLASYLSPESASSLKAPVLPSKPLRVTSALVGKGYTAAGQAGACLHTMSVLQAYQADLLKELDEGEEIKDSDISELRRTADLSLRATKETARAIGRSMAALVVAERHLWLTLSDMKEKDRVFLLDAPLSPSGLFGDAVNTVVDRYQEARKQAAAFQRYLPRRHSAHGAAATEQPRPSTSSSHREAQKQSVATRTPPHRERVVKRTRSRTSQGKPDLRFSVSGSPLCPRETVLLTLPVLQGAAVSSEHPPQSLPPGNVAGLGSSPPPAGSLGPLVQVLPAGQPLQDTVPAAHITPEASLERLVPLVDHLAAWKLLPNVSAWVLHTVERGYRIQFGAPPPPFNGVSPTLVGPEQGLVMEQEVATLLRKEAIEVVPPLDRESGFYSRYFIVPKKDGGLRPILDLRLLNRSVKRLKFKMLTIKQVVSQIRSEDWFVTIDLKDAYFHVSILPQHRKFLRFAFRGEAYQYRVLPFGLALSPRTFTKCVDAALAPLRLQGIRILNYIDDWLILAQSEMVAVRHRDVVLAHMKALGLRLNAKKSVLSPSQSTTYLGVVWDSTTMQARLSPARIESILTAVKRVKLGQSLTVKQFQQLLGLMAAASNVIPFGLLYMRPLQWWLKTKGFSPGKSISHDQGHAALPTCLGHGPVLGAPCRRVTLATDASLTGWGAVMSGHPARGLWSGRHLTWHINCLEMLAVFLALKHFLPDLRDRHVLVRTDNTSVVSYINHQGGLRSRPLYKLAHQILVWSQGKLLSLRAVYVPGHLNLGADILSRQGPRPGEWMLHPEVVKQIWRVFGPAQVDLFATRENTQCPLWCSLVHPAPLGLDAMVQTWPRLRLYAFPPIALLPGVLERVRRDGVSLLLVAPFWPGRVWFSDLISLLDGSPWEIPVRRDLLSQAGVPSFTPGRSYGSFGAPSTRKLYALKWKLFTSWCGRHQQDPVNCPVGSVLEFLQDRLSAGLSHSTLKVYVAAIAAYHAPLGGFSVGKDPLVTRFLRGVLRLRPPVRPRVPTWDLSVVLEALCRPPFEPIEGISDKFLSLKTVLLIALSSLKRVGDLQALSVAPSFLDFAPGLSKAFLYPRSGYLPKVPSSTPQPVVLQAFCPPPFRDSDQQKLNCMCPVRALDTYVHKSASWRKTDQLFVCFGPPKRGLPASKQSLSRWIVDAICLAYEASDLPPPLGVRAHSTRSMAASKAFLAGHILGRDWESGGVGISERDAASRSHPPASLRALLLSWKLTLVLAHVLLCFLVSDVTRL